MSTENLATSNVVAGTVAAGAAVAAVVAYGPKITGAFSDLSTDEGRNSAARFLNRATFGATDASVQTLASSTVLAWCASQREAAPQPGGAPGYWTKTPSFHLDWITRRQADFDDIYKTALAAAGDDPVAKAKVSRRTPDRLQFQESFWTRAVTGDDQLRHRMALALSEIFVVSLNGSTITPRIAASWYDMLSARAFGSYADLLKAVTLHPAMGLYLNIIGNQQADNDPTRHPDENYAREVMQLMSIGQVKLKPDGAAELDAAGKAIPAYSYADIGGLAKVFTGWGWYAATPTANTFARQPGTGTLPTSPDVQNLISYPTYHSQLEKTFLGATVPAYTGAKPTTQAGANALRDYQIAGLDKAIATLAAHPNVGPFIGRRLIQRFVTSNPSNLYITRVTEAFNRSGGNLFETLQAVLMDAEAMETRPSAVGGKLREPIMRMAHWLRACEATSKPTASSAVGNFVQFADLGDPGQLNQAPLQAPSVFNFFDPDFAAPGSAMSRAGLTAPEFQGVDSLTVAAYANLIAQVVQAKGWPGGDVTVTYAKEIAAVTPAAAGGPYRDQALIDRINLLFFGGAMSSTLSARLLRVIAGTRTTAKAPTQAQLLSLYTDKVRNSLIITLTSPEYLVQT